MSDNLPRTVEEYKLWWASQTDVPYGYCWCGCSEKTNLVKETASKQLQFKDQPVRYLRGHHNFKSSLRSQVTKHREWWTSQSNVPYGQCWCGCGEQTALATATSTQNHHVKGEPVRYAKGHSTRLNFNEEARQYRLEWEQTARVPYGYCWCGCGKKTRIADINNIAAQVFRGEPRRFIVGHAARPSVFELDDVRLQHRKRWEESRPSIPYGKCWCGCGGTTRLADNTCSKIGDVHGAPRRYMSGHRHPMVQTRLDREKNAREFRQRWSTETDQPYGYCQCGCGEKTGISPQTDTKRGVVIGEPCKFRAGHFSKNRTPIPEPNPGGLCMCGCGRQTNLASKNSLRYGTVKGKPLRYLRGHYNRPDTGEWTDPNPSGICLCGCGKRTKVIDYVNAAKQVKPGFHNRYVVGHVNRKFVRRYIEQDSHLGTPCWIWQGALSEQGYGRFDKHGKSRLAHRVYYKELKGGIPDGLVLDHLCNQRSCVNPDHLEAVPQSTNSRVGRTRNLSELHKRVVQTLANEGYSTQEICSVLHLRESVVNHLL